MPDEHDQSRPRLASELWRSSIAGLVAFVPLLVGQFLFSLFGPDLPRAAALVTSLFLFWTYFGTIYFALTVATFRHASFAKMSGWLRATRPTNESQRMWRAMIGGEATSWSVQVSVFAVLSVVILSLVPGLRAERLVVLSGVTIVVASWLMVVGAYAVRYIEEHAVRPCLQFPGDETASPRFGDAVYLAVQVSTTFSTSDVGITTTDARRIVTAHSIIAFVFNTVIVALLVSALVASAG